MRAIVVMILVAAAVSLPTATAAQLSGSLVVWSRDAGSISGTGLYTAPNTPGTYHVTATSDGVTGSATVVVFAQPTRPFPWMEVAALCGVLRCDRLARAAVSEFRWRTRRLIGFRITDPMLLALAFLAVLAAAARGAHRRALRAA